VANFKGNLPGMVVPGVVFIIISEKYILHVRCQPFIKIEVTIMSMYYMFDAILNFFRERPFNLKGGVMVFS